MLNSKSVTSQRYKPCQVLSDHQVRYVIWFEDALYCYGVPTAVFDLYLLVPDIDKAANVLVQAGWVVDSEGPFQIGSAEVKFPQRKLLLPNSSTVTILLPVQDWKFPLAEHLAPTDTSQEDTVSTKGSFNVLFPPLPGFLDALIESWLDCTSDDALFLLHLACHISYLYAHTPALKERSFGEQLRYEHRQFHNDVVAGMQTGTLPFRRHQLAIRDALLQGEYKLQECSASWDTPDMFHIHFGAA